MVQKTNDLSPAGEFSRQSIIREARLLFSSGYSSASIDRILLKLNLTKGSFYHHFEDKKALFKAVVAEVQQDVATNAELAGKGAESAEKELTAICRSFYSQLQRGDVMRIICRDAGSILTSEECGQIDEQYMGAVLGRAIRRAQQEKLLSEELSPDALIRIITGAIYQTLEWGWDDETGQRVADGEKLLLQMLHALMRR
ncbi:MULTISPECIES: TetR/AcrR family transcriptional regulator [Rhizobium]|uniref:HTH tetR-type domain-containing protein n=1 Tax=Rhizobium leguminosarum TaxID=384 RepID=A0A1B1CPF9_RHILE|nr:TetR/AcrR family transcriptional regulator [Rhizobium leguminosarum]ANP91653.1 hypothetical protein BA011_36810 [Rhizobium leguminosarum]API57533.1 hypothetical protein BMW22_40120 [Rhizobium leguminosarum]